MISDYGNGTAVQVMFERYSLYKFLTSISFYYLLMEWSLKK